MDFDTIAFNSLFFVNSFMSVTEEAEKMSAILKQLPLVKTLVITQSVIYSVGLPIIIVYRDYPALYASPDYIKTLIIVICIGIVEYTVFYTIMCMTAALTNLRHGGRLEIKGVFEFSGITTNVIITAVLVWEMIRFYFIGKPLASIDPTRTLVLLFSGVLVFELIYSFVLAIKKRSQIDRK